MLNDVSVRYQPLPFHRLNQFSRKVSPVRGVFDSGLLPNKPYPSKQGRVTHAGDNHSLIAKLYHKKHPGQWDIKCFSLGAQCLKCPLQDSKDLGSCLWLP